MKFLRDLFAGLTGAPQSTFMDLDEGGQDVFVEAAKQAQQTLPAFWGAYDSDAAVRETAMLKVGLTTYGGGTEHIWAGEIRREGDEVRGRLLNHPEHLPGVRRGTELVIHPHKVSDWGYVKNDRLWGAYTNRASLGIMPKRDAAEMRAWLSPTPLEEDQ